jgi:hypothetical protein
MGGSPLGRSPLFGLSRLPDPVTHGHGISELFPSLRLSLAGIRKRLGDASVPSRELLNQVWPPLGEYPSLVAVGQRPVFAGGFAVQLEIKPRRDRSIDETQPVLGRFADAARMPWWVPHQLDSGTGHPIHFTDFLFNFRWEGSRNRAVSASQSHLNQNASSVINYNIVDQSQVVDVDWKFGIEAGQEGFVDPLFEEKFVSRMHS